MMGPAIKPAAWPKKARLVSWHCDGCSVKWQGERDGSRCWVCGATGHIGAIDWCPNVRP